MFIGVIGILACSPANSQDYNSAKGYIVTTGHDTIAGLIKKRPDILGQVTFKSHSAEGYTVYPANKIRAFATEDGHQYKAIVFQEKAIFGLVLVTAVADASPLKSIHLLSASELTANGELYAREGSKWGDQWQYMVDAKTGRLWVEVLFAG